MIELGAVVDMEGANIGSGERLDFTLIGRKVNVAARIKAFADQAGETIICTRAFRDRFGAGMRRLGEFEAKGLREPPELFAPAAFDFLHRRRRPVTRPP